MNTSWQMMNDTADPNASASAARDKLEGIQKMNVACSSNRIATLTLIEYWDMMHSFFNKCDPNLARTYHNKSIQ